VSVNLTDSAMDTYGTATAVAHPSLALVKYWGKQSGGINIPATGSLGVSLGALTTTTTVSITDRDRIIINGTAQDPQPFQPLLTALRREISRRKGIKGGGGAEGTDGSTGSGFLVESENDFPTAAGLASSASGFAALVTAAFAAAGCSDVPASVRSECARIGSGSAARSVHGGFVLWNAGSVAAEELHGPEWWPELRIVVLPLSDGKKPVTSRSGMNHTRETSPYYSAWVADAPALLERCRRAVDDRSLPALGPVMRASYMRMFATMLGADPPILYWLPATISVLHRLEVLRGEGLPVWETMDAGPQVKVVTTAEHTSSVVAELRSFCVSEPVVSPVGGPAVTVGTAR
jgi:diphosphomevalonate decarboxylase